ncbi:MAG: hypothetical protein ACRCYQ_00985 [Nocardioides sp.]
MRRRAWGLAILAPLLLAVGYGAKSVHDSRDGAGPLEVSSRYTFVAAHTRVTEKFDFFFGTSLCSRADTAKISDLRVVRFDGDGLDGVDIEVNWQGLDSSGGVGPVQDLSSRYGDERAGDVHSCDLPEKDIGVALILKPKDRTMTAYVRNVTLGYQHEERSREIDIPYLYAVCGREAKPVLKQCRE